MPVLVVNPLGIGPRERIGLPDRSHDPARGLERLSIEELYNALRGAAVAADDLVAQGRPREARKALVRVQRLAAELARRGLGEGAAVEILEREEPGAASGAEPHRGDGAPG